MGQTFRVRNGVCRDFLGFRRDILVSVRRCGAAIGYQHHGGRAGSGRHGLFGYLFAFILSFLFPALVPFIIVFLVQGTVLHVTIG